MLTCVTSSAKGVGTAAMGHTLSTSGAHSKSAGHGASMKATCRLHTLTHALALSSMVLRLTMAYVRP